MRFASNIHDNTWKCMVFLLLFAKLTCTIDLNDSKYLNVTHHLLSIGFNTFILETTVTGCDVTTINMLMNSLILACKWSIDTYKYNFFLNSIGLWNNLSLKTVRAHTIDKFCKLLYSYKYLVNYTHTYEVCKL